jgi:hypothetical protein
MESNKLSVVVMLAADILLVLTMLLGLLRSRDRSGGMFGLARLLWKQVRCSTTAAFLVGFSALNPLIYFLSARVSCGS